MKKEVIFLGIVLNCMVMFNSKVFSNTYITGTNKVEKEIRFELIVEDSLYVSKGTELDFGIIPKGITGTIIKQSYIEIVGGEEGTVIKVDYEGGELQEDGYKKFQIKYKEEISDEKDVKSIKKNESNDDKLELDIFLKDFEERYTLEKIDDSIGLKIPIIGEIRGTENVKLGKYEEKFKVNILTVSINKGVNNPE